MTRTGPCLAFALLACCGTPGCADPGTDRDDVEPDRAASDATSAVITGHRLDEETLHVDVVSTGCTERHHLEPRTRWLDEQTVAVTLVRTVPDRCRRMPFAETFAFPRTSLGAGDVRVVVTNPRQTLPPERRD